MLRLTTEEADTRLDLLDQWRAEWTRLGEQARTTLSQHSQPRQHAGGESSRAAVVEKLIRAMRDQEEMSRESLMDEWRSTLDV